MTEENDSSSEKLFDRLNRVLPPYLTSFSREELKKQLRSFPIGNNYFSYQWTGPESPIQGDGWNGFTEINFRSLELKAVAGVVVSNSCDIDESNISLRKRNILFAPIVKLSDYIDRLKEYSHSISSIKSHISAICAQEKTELFYIPKSNRTPECLVMLDSISHQPLEAFLNSQRERLFRLNEFGFYIFLMKLSIHLTRFGENLDRQFDSKV